MALAVGLKEPTLGNFETGKTELSPDALKRLADYFKVSPAELLAPAQSSTPVKPNLKDAAIDYHRHAARLLVQDLTDEQIIQKMTVALSEPAKSWPDRIGTARVLLLELEARHAGE